MHLVRNAANTCFVILLASTITVVVQAQETPPPETEAVCTIDLSNPAQMSDVMSNALMRGLGEEESKVKAFLKGNQEKYKTGHELAAAAASAFDVKEETLSSAIEKYRHINCTHEGGGESFSSDGKISEFAQNVLTHVVVHEMGHSLVREFGLPTLGNEETLADAFATYYIVTKLPDRALPILEARISSWMIEAAEVPREKWTVKGEHNSDARRAYQVAALAIAHDADKFASLAKLVDMDESEVRSATDYGAEILRSWRRILAPLWMPDGERSQYAQVTIDEGSIFGAAIKSHKLDQEFATFLSSFDWHSQVTVHFAGGKGGAGWNRSKRTITVHDEYIHRFNTQGTLHSKRGSKELTIR
jgi:hypothetical protein